MKAISRAIEKFCHRHRKFGIPQLMKYIVFISGAVFILIMMDSQQMTLYRFMLFSPDLILRGEVWRIITWVFLPLNDNPIFAMISLYFYYFVGTTLEREWGTPKFTIYYISGILLNIIYGFVLRYAVGISPIIYLLSSLLNPFFLNLSLFFAFAVLFPEHPLRLFFLIPIKVKWLALLNALVFVYRIFDGLRMGNTAMAFLPVVALLNFFIICGGDLHSLLRPIKARSSSRFSNYSRAAKKARRGADDKPYRHKCAVCGRSDADYPDLEFRYCSRCEGYHCFCIDHINNHVHFL